jgi:hypothetical protein
MRRPPGKINPVLVACVIPLIVIIAAVAFLVVRNRLHSLPQPFDLAAYSHSSKDLEGNEYSLDATIDSQLRWDEGFGRYLTVKQVNGDGRLGVFVPESVASDVRVGQRYHMKVVVKDQGLVQVESMEKY